MCLIPASRVTQRHHSNGCVRTLLVFILRPIRKPQMYCVGDKHSSLMLQRMVVHTVTTKEYAGT